MEQTNTVTETEMNVKRKETTKLGTYEAAVFVI